MTEKIFKRKIYSQLLRWKRESNGKTALLIEGARRVGKSTIVEMFDIVHLTCSQIMNGYY